MKSRKSITIRLTFEQYDLIKKICDEYGTTMQELVVTRTLTNKDLKKIKKEESDLYKVMKRQDELEDELKFIRQSLTDLSNALSKISKMY